jgi:hypothetical protein
MHYGPFHALPEYCITLPHYSRNKIVPYEDNDNEGQNVSSITVFLSDLFRTLSLSLSLYTYSEYEVSANRSLQQNRPLLNDLFQTFTERQSNGTGARSFPGTVPLEELCGLRYYPLQGRRRQGCCSTCRYILKVYINRCVYRLPPSERTLISDFKGAMPVCEFLHLLRSNSLSCHV